MAPFASFLGSGAGAGLQGADCGRWMPWSRAHVVGQKAFVAGDFGSLVVTWPVDCRLVLIARATDGQSETSSAARPRSSRRRRTG